MSDMSDAMIWAVTILAGMAMVCAVVLRGWRGWLDLRRLELASRMEEPRHDDYDSNPALRIELSAMKERLRKLEAIARGVDL
jgi:hypothetical protein